MTENQHRQDWSADTPPLSTAALGAAAEATVLIVDDQIANVVLLERLLGAVGVGRVHGFTDPRLAFAHCTSALPDLVLLDLHMPVMDGFAFMEALQILLPTGGFLPILVLTADVTPEVKQRALSSGAKDFLTKPFDRTEVLMRVSNLLETRALYRRLEEQNVMLQAELDARLAAEREAAAENERRIDHAMAPGSVSVLFQPVADLTTGDVVGVEALPHFLCEPLRSRDQWLAEAEHVGRGAELELAVTAAALDKFDLLAPDMFMAVSVSPATAVTPELDVLLSRHPNDRVVLQLAEQARIDDYDTLRTALIPFRERGGRIAADNTGAGFASFKHLDQLSPDIIKLDIALSRGIEADPARRALAAALVTFATEISATVIAKEIQLSGELAALQRIGIPWGEGHHLAGPGVLPLSHRALGHIGTRSP